MASGTITTASDKDTKPQPPKLVKSLWWLVVLAQLFSFGFGFAIHGSLPLANHVFVAGTEAQRLYALFYLGWMYVSVRCILESFKRTSNSMSRYDAGLCFMILAPFLPVLMMLIIALFIHPL
jgi:hypothetical protein